MSADRDSVNHLLRTLAAVPPTSTILMAGLVPESAAESLGSLGFDAVSISENSGEMFDWAVLFLRAARLRSCSESLATLRPHVRPGGWVFVSLELVGAWDPEAGVAAEVRFWGPGYAVAEAPTMYANNGDDPSELVFIVRKVDDATRP